MSDGLMGHLSDGRKISAGLRPKPLNKSERRHLMAAEVFDSEGA